MLTSAMKNVGGNLIVFGDRHLSSTGKKCSQLFINSPNKGLIKTMEEYNKGEGDKFLGSKGTNVINGLISEVRGGGESRKQPSIKKN